VFSLALGVAFVPAPFISTHRVQKIPDAPAAPTIPPTIPTEIAPAAKKSFEAQVESYDKAVKTRNAAIEAAANEIKTVAADDKDANRLTLYLGLAGLLVMIFGPVLIDVKHWKLWK
jgi:hypothetical protein